MKTLFGVCVFAYQYLDYLTQMDIATLPKMCTTPNILHITYAILNDRTTDCYAFDGHYKPSLVDLTL